MVGSIKDYTTHLKLIIPKFDVATWHDYMETNFRAIDALLYNVYGINNFKGEWSKLTEYKKDDVVFVGEDKTISGQSSEYEGRLVKVLVDHVTDSSEGFHYFYEANPTFYELFFDANNAAYFAQKSKESADNSEISYQNSKNLETIYIDYRDITEQYKDLAQQSAQNAATSETNATTAANTAVSTVQTATELLNTTQQYTTAALQTIADTRDEAVGTIESKVAAAEIDITDTVTSAINSVNNTKQMAETSIITTKDEAESNISLYVDEAIIYVKEEGVKAAQGAIKDVTDAAKEAKDNAVRSEVAADRAEEAAKTVTGVYRVKGSVQNVADLPTTGQQNGDVYNILDTGANYVWDGIEWDKLSETVDLSNYYNKQEVDTKLDNKQDTLTAGTNITIVREGTKEQTITTSNFPIPFIANGNNLSKYRIYGNLSQNGTPTPTNPVDIVGVGEIIEVTNGSLSTNIQLTSPLYKIGDRKDYIDSSIGKVYRNCKKVDLSTLNWTASVSGGKYRFSATLSDYVPNVSAGRATNIYFNRFAYSTLDNYGIGFGHSNKNVYIYVDSNIQTVTQLQSWLANNNSYIIYPISLTIIEDVTLPNIPTKNGANSLSIIGLKPSEMSIVYSSGGGDLIISATHDATKQDTLTAGTGIDITNNVISSTQSSVSWGNISGTLSNQTDLQNALNDKQDTLIAGEGIKIEDNVISLEDDIVDFVQPLLSKNEVFGGAKFAVLAENEIDPNRQAWKAFDGNTVLRNAEYDQWHSYYGQPHWIAWSNPTAMTVTQVTIYNGADNVLPLDWQFEYSDDSVDWVELTNGTNTNLTANGMWSFDVANSGFHRFYRFKTTSGYGVDNQYLGLTEIQITGKVVKSQTKHYAEADESTLIGFNIQDAETKFYQNISRQNASTQINSTSTNMEANLVLYSQYDSVLTENSKAVAEISVGESGITTQMLKMTNDKTTFIGNVDFSNASVKGIADVIYPVGSIYIGVQDECPMKAVIQDSEWVKVSEGRVLQGSDSSHTAGTTISAGLPNITGNFNFQDSYNRDLAYQATKAFKLGSQVTSSGTSSSGSITRYNGISFDASRESSIYGNSTTVQPPAFVVNIWQRTA